MYKQIFFLLVLVCGVYSSLLDIFGLTNGREPRVALHCGKVPFYVDLETGNWVADSEGKQKCDGDKEEVKSFCQKIYPKLNITNIVEANDPVEFKNWCSPGSSQCDYERKVVPYRCLVNEYEADALMVPDSCKFDHIHDQDLCMSHDQWRERAEETCSSKYGMKVKDYGILLSCKTDLFTGVEFVCCPERVIKEAKVAEEHARKVAEEEKKKQEEKKKEEEAHKHTKEILIPSKAEIDHDLFAEAIRNFQTYLPMETKGCDRSAYLTKRTKMEDRHRDQIAAVVDEWDEAEKKYNQLKLKDPVSAEEKMKRTLEVFRQTLAALEQESKEEKSRLRAEHAECINTQINKDKRDAMIKYLQTIEETPVNAEHILQAVRNFIQVCEHDRVHSLRHFEHVRNRDPKEADEMRGQLLQHLKNLNKVVNESMALLNYLPEIAEQFGLTGSVGGAILKPRLEMPEEEPHDHERVHEILKEGAKKYGSIEASPNTDKVIKPTDDIPVEPKPVSEVVTPKLDEHKSYEEKLHEAWEKELKEEKEEHEEMDEEEREKKEMIFEKESELIDNAEKHDEELTKEEREEKEKFFEMEKKLLQKVLERQDMEEEEDEEERIVREHQKVSQKKGNKTPVAITAILGLSIGILVIMLFVVIAMVVRRRRLNVTRVVLSENGDDREHLVQMQKSGFENPTYKFFYY